MCLGNIWPILIRKWCISWKLSVWSLEKWCMFLVCLLICVLACNLSPPALSWKGGDKHSREWKRREGRVKKQGSQRVKARTRQGSFRRSGGAEDKRRSTTDWRVNTSQSDNSRHYTVKTLRGLKCQFDPVNMYGNAFIFARRSELAKILIYWKTVSIRSIAPPT